MSNKQPRQGKSAASPLKAFTKTTEAPQQPVESKFVTTEAINPAPPIVSVVVPSLPEPATVILPSTITDTPLNADVKVDAAPAPSKEQEKPAPRFSWVANVITTLGSVQLIGKIPMTHEELKAKTAEFHNDGFVLFSEDGLKATTFMPRSIQRVIWTLVPIVEVAGEAK